MVLGALIIATPIAAEEPPVFIPVIESSHDSARDAAWQISGDPDLGDYTTPGQQPVDFAIWQAADSTWQLWSCIRKTKCGGATRLFYRWEGDELTDSDWQPMGIAQEARTDLGETAGGMQAPHVVRFRGLWFMAYGDWEHICLSRSRDGKTFKRMVGTSGRTGMFTEGSGANTRDAMLLDVGGLWHCYYTAFPNRQGAVFCRTSTDLRRWSESVTVAFGGRTGTGATSAECPHVVEYRGRYYLFRTQRYGRNMITSVYHSTDPKMFGINQDRLYFLCTLPVAAPEIIFHDGQYYIATLKRSLKGIEVARLGWAPVPRPGESLFDLDDADVRARWKLVDGNVRPVFTTSKRSSFRPHYRHFVGTAEALDGRLNDAWTGTIESPAFTIRTAFLFAAVSGGTDSNETFVSLVDVESGEEIARMASESQSNTLQLHTIATSQHVGKQAVVRIADRATGDWGHVNFGGLFEPAAGDAAKE